MKFIVETGVKGAMRINRSEFSTRAEAEAFAARWRSSNSTGQYVAYVEEGYHTVYEEIEDRMSR